VSASMNEPSLLSPATETGEHGEARQRGATKCSNIAASSLLSLTALAPFGTDLSDRSRTALGASLSSGEIFDAPQAASSSVSAQATAPRSWRPGAWRRKSAARA
jgi:hypothetical protein